MAKQQEGKGEALADLFFEVAAYFFRMRAVGRQFGFISKRGSGTLGFMRTLATTGPITIPDLARMRPTSRQRMQQLADELAEKGLVEFIDNPRHRKSSLVRLTRKGQAHYQAMLKQLYVVGAELAKEVDLADLRKTTALLRNLRERTPAG